MPAIASKKPSAILPKEISWLLFNERVLQEADDERNPLVERLKFLGIFSNNLDEFYRVRVASLQRLEKEEGAKHVVQGIAVGTLLRQIRERVLASATRFNAIFRALMRELEEEGIHIVDEKHLDAEQREFVLTYFREQVRPRLVPILCHRGKDLPTLRDKSIYLAVEIETAMAGVPPYALVEVPTESLSRFLILPRKGAKDYIILLEDVIRACLQDVFGLFRPTEVRAWTVKITRDSELELDPEVSENYLKRVHLGLRKRKDGDPVRMVYDRTLPEPFLRFLLRKMGIGKDEDILPGQRYHNLKDFIKFPHLGRKHLVCPADVPVAHPALDGCHSVLDVVAKQDILLHYPYHSFSSFVDLLREAAIDPTVTDIALTVYRVSQTSSVLNALINAARNGKQVIVLMEVLARFDEENNISWANKLREEGVEVIIGVRGLKVHSKLCLVTRRNGRKVSHVAGIGTGNFNEDTARIYTDHLLLTSDPAITTEVVSVFEFFRNNFRVPDFDHLIVCPFEPRKAWTKLIREEIRNARLGKQAYIWVKLNNLADVEMIREFQEASKAGVEVRMIVRGMNSLVPGIEGVSENIEIRSLVGRYLEHSRYFVFANGGNPKVYLTSGDWMARNFDGRVEVTAPLRDNNIKMQLVDYFELQWADTANARLCLTTLNNQRPAAPAGMPDRDCHKEIRAWLLRTAQECYKGKR